MFLWKNIVPSYIFKPLNILDGPSFRLTQFLLENLQVLGNIWIPPLKNTSIFVKCRQFMKRILDIFLTKVKIFSMLQISRRLLSAVTVKSQFSTDCLGKVKIKLVKQPNQTLWFLCVNEISFAIGKVLLDWILILG